MPNKAVGSGLVLPHFFCRLPLRIADEKECGNASPDPVDPIRKPHRGDPSMAVAVTVV